MEKLFYYTGAMFWILLSVLAAVFILIWLWRLFKKTIVWKWIDIQLATLRYITFSDKKECNQYTMKFYKDRLEFLQERGLRKFEQKFLEKLIKISVVKPIETIFG